MSAARQFIESVPASEIRDGDEIMHRDARVRVWEIGKGQGNLIVLDIGTHQTFLPNQHIWRFLTPGSVADERRLATRHELRPVRAEAISAVAVDGEVEVLAVGPQPVAYRIGPVAASTLYMLLGEALIELEPKT